MALKSSRRLRAGGIAFLAMGLLVAAIAFEGARKSQTAASYQFAADPMTDLASRSPGLRTGMLQLKNLRFEPVAPEEPHERVLAGEREHPIPPAFLLADLLDVPPEPLWPPLYIGFPPVGEGPLPVIGGPPGGVGGSPLRLTDGPRGGAGPVPELSTWATLIVGLFAAGTAIRRRVAQARAAGEGKYEHP